MAGVFIARSDPGFLYAIKAKIDVSDEYKTAMDSMNHVIRGRNKKTLMFPAFADIQCFTFFQHLM